MSEQKNTTANTSALEAWLKRKAVSQTEKQIPVQDESTPTVLSYSQKRLWLLQQVFPENPFYQYGHIYRFQGPLEVELLQKAFAPITRKYSILRTTFKDTPDGPRQVAGTDQSLQIELQDLSQLPTDQQEAAAEKIIWREVRQTFDLSKGPLIRMKMLKFSETSFWLVMVMHHIVIDRWSLDLINQEVSQQYLALKNGSAIELDPLPFQYSDYARWQQSLPLVQKDLDYWLNKLSGELASFALPTDFTRPTTPSFQGAMLKMELTTELSERIRALSKKHHTTIYVVLLAAFKALLHRYSDQTDILVGSPFSNRDKLSLEKQAGLFNETLTLRTEVSEAQSFQELIEAVKTTTLEGLAHKNVPFDTLVQKLNPERLGNYNPLFQVMFSYKTMVPPPDFGEDIQVEEDTLDLGVAKFDLTLYGLDLQDHLLIDLVYATDLYRESTAQGILDHLRQLLEVVTQTPTIKLGDIPLLTETEFQQQIVRWNDTARPLSKGNSIHELIEQQAHLYPDKTSVVFQDQSLTYAELNEKAENLASHLLARGVQVNTPVGLYCERSVDMVVGILGILKAGAAYLPLDPEYPAERISFMLQDSGAKLLVGQRHLLQQLLNQENLKVIPLQEASQRKKEDAPPRPQVKREHLAYIIYTSGSTGLPKGVPISHGNLIHSTTARFDFYEEDPTAFLLLSSFSFDSSVAGIFWSLCSGGKLILPPKRIEQDMDALSRVIHQHQVSHTLMLPSLYGLLLAHSQKETLQSLQVVMVAGEACAPSLVQQHFRTLPNTKLYNEYGPTEASVWCIAHRIQEKDANGVPIGKPIPNTQAYILNRRLQPVPVGVPGELYIAGSGLAKGYLNRPELNAERFIPHPFSDLPQEKMYKTGDLARFAPDGTIEFLGRADHQIKIRGHRVEPDEIAAILKGHQLVEEAIVIVRQNENEGVSQNSLIAYVSGQDLSETGKLRDFLRTKLPDYMVPAAIIPLPEFPRLPNGKINRKTLPAPAATHFTRTTEFVAPSSELECQLAEVWQEVLQQDRISVHANFFDIGGDSILSIQIVAKARQAGIQLAANQLFEHQTISTLARSMEASDPNRQSSLVPLNARGHKPPLFCIHSGGAHVFFYQSLARHLEDDQPVYGLQPKGLAEVKNYHSSIEEMAAHYIEEIKKVQASGPYQILGTCFSNAVALEMGNQLRAAGEMVDRLFIIDSGPVHLFGDTANGKKATLRRFWDMLKRGDLHRIKSKIISRLTTENKQQQRFEEINPEEDFKEMIESMNAAYTHYNWTPYPGEIHFIRSSEFHKRPDKKYHLQQWNKLAAGGLEVHVVPGHHLTLFKEPEVQGLAEKITDCLEAVKV